jgi:hypothetical protein
MQGVLLGDLSGKWHFGGTHEAGDWVTLASTMKLAEKDGWEKLAAVAHPCIPFCSSYGMAWHIGQTST